MKKRIYLIVFSSLLVHTLVHSQESLTIEERTSIKEVWDISYDFDESLWDSFNEPPFSILLIGSETEFLVDHYYQPDDFSRQTYDTIIHSTVHTRPKTQSFPMGTLDFHGLFTITTQLDDFRKLSYEQKLLFLIRERMHQYQYSSERYFLELDKLGLFDINQIKKNGEFKYELSEYKSVVSSALNKYLNSLSKAIVSLNTPEMDNAFFDLIEARKHFNYLVSPQDRKYMAFIKYHQGIALYTQYKLLQKKEATDSTYQYLKDSFILDQMNGIEGIELNNITNDEISKIGFLEALLLDQQNPYWLKKYLDAKFDLAQFFDEIEP